MIGMKNRDQLSGAVLDEFENLIASLNGFLSTAFEEDGTLRETSAVVEVKTGTIFLWSTDTAPAGYTLCDGSQLSRLDYRALYDVIGVTYGVGDGTTTFNVPDMRGRFPLGKAAAGTGATLASTGGNIDHTHSGGSVSGSTGATAPSGSAASNGAHTHAGPSHTHTFSTGAPNEANQQREGPNVDPLATPTTGHTHSGTTAADGTGSTSSDGAHTHTVSVDSHTHGAGTLAVATTGAANPPFLSLQYIIRT